VDAWACPKIQRSEVQLGPELSTLPVDAWESIDLLQLWILPPRA
jgi:hypothetical protein